MWSTSVGGHFMKVVNLTGFTVFVNYLFYTGVPVSVMFLLPCRWQYTFVQFGLHRNF